MSSFLIDLRERDGQRKSARQKATAAKLKRERQDNFQRYQRLVSRPTDRPAAHRSGFAERAKRKDARDADAVTKIGPVVARAALDWFSSERGKKVLERLRALDIQPRGRTAGNVQSDFRREDVCSYGLA